MELTEEYLAENDDAVRRNFRAGTIPRFPFKNKPIHLTSNDLRFKRIINFVGSNPGRRIKILSVGSGGHEPLRIRSNYAIDIVPISEILLRKVGYTGEFKIASCDNIPYPDKFFDVAVCSEVIEHLPLIDTVIDTFKELDRVAKSWIVTTPCVAVKEPTHKHLFTYDWLLKVTNSYHVKIIIEGGFFFVEKTQT